MEQISEMEKINEDMEADVALVTRDAESGEKKFRIQNPRYLLTYKTHLPKDEMKPFFDKITKCSVNECIVAHETSDKTNEYDHTHIFLDVGKSFSSLSCRIFDYKGIHPNIKPVVTKRWEAVYRYISKQDPDLIELAKKYVKSSSLASSVWKYDTLEEMLEKEAFSPGDVSGLKTLFECKPVLSAPVMGPEDHLKYEWQVALWVKMRRADHWDYRGVQWIYDQWFSMGKSRFADTWESNYGSIVLSNISGQKDSATVIATSIASGWNQQVIFCDFTKAEENHRIYGSLETFLNGRVTVVKYQGKPVRINPTNGATKPMVVVMANFLPDFDSSDIMAEDRFCIWDIHEDGTYEEYKNEKRLRRLEREHGEISTRWTLEELEKMAKNGEFEKNSFRLQNYLDHVKPDYIFGDENPFGKSSLGSDMGEILEKNSEIFSVPFKGVSVHHIVKGEILEEMVLKKKEEKIPRLAAKTKVEILRERKESQVKKNGVEKAVAPVVGRKTPVNKIVNK
jgi:hypothetical protein